MVEGREVGVVIGGQPVGIMPKGSGRAISLSLLLERRRWESWGGGFGGLEGRLVEEEGGLGGLATLDAGLGFYYRGRIKILRGCQFSSLKRIGPGTKPYK